MPVHLDLVNFDNLYNSISTEKILINYEDVFNEKNKERIDSLIFKNYSQDTISIVPSCMCTDGLGLKGAYYVGETCNRCNTKVTASIDDNVSFLVWVKRPEGVERFISPIVISMLSSRYKISKPNVNLIEYIMFPDYKIDKKQQKKNLASLEHLDFLLHSNNIPRGYNSFILNFFKIIDILETEFCKKKPNFNITFYEFLLLNKDKIFSDYLPFPNRTIFAIESNELGKFIDKTFINPINVIRRLTGIDLYSKPSNIKQNKVARSLIDISEFYVTYMKNVLFNKPGLIRQHISSTRSSFTARAVITSITKPHIYDEIYIPWSVACTLFIQKELQL